MNVSSHNREEQERRSASGVEEPGVGYEQSDVSVRGVVWFGLGLFILIGLICGLMWLMFKYFERREKTAEPPPASRISTAEPRVPPEPRLQGAPGHQTLPQMDMKELRESEDAVLTRYGWVDREAGIVRIPIELAKKLVAERGLPSRPAIEAPARSRPERVAEPSSLTKNRGKKQ